MNPVRDPTIPLTGWYLSVLRAMHRATRPRTYLEIGVWRGESLRLASRSTRAVGIDPRPLVTGRLPRRWSIVPQTSDEFFARPDVAELVGTVDIAFIDGLHYFEQVVRDFANVERLMAPDGVIVLHDCLPPNPAVAAREKHGDVWAGDVWKVVPILREHRPDLTVTMAAVAPTGLAVVTGLDPTSRVLDVRYDEIVRAHAARAFEPPVGDVDGSWAAVADLFPVYGPARPLDVVERKLRTAARVAQRRLSVL